MIKILILILILLVFDFIEIFTQDYSLSIGGQLFYNMKCKVNYLKFTECINSEVLKNGVI